VIDWSARGLVVCVEVGHLAVLLLSGLHWLPVEIGAGDGYGGPNTRAATLFTRIANEIPGTVLLVVIVIMVHSRGRF